MSSHRIPDHEAEQATAEHEAGRDLLHAGDPAAAIPRLEAAAALDPHFKTLELLGEAWLRLDEPRRAVVPLAAATTLNRQVRAPALLAEALWALGEDLRAHEIAKLALDREPNNKRARRVFEETEERYKKWESL